MMGQSFKFSKRVIYVSNDYRGVKARINDLLVVKFSQLAFTDLKVARHDHAEWKVDLPILVNSFFPHIECRKHRLSPD